MLKVSHKVALGAFVLALASTVLAAFYLVNLQKKPATNARDKSVTSQDHTLSVQRKNAIKSLPVNETKTKKKPKLTPKTKRRTMRLPGMNEFDNAEFPELKVLTRSSFAHDRGDMTSVESIHVSGQETTLANFVEALVKTRNGWSQDGKCDHETVKKVCLSLWLNMARQLGQDVLNDEVVPSDLSSVLGGQAANLGTSKRSGPVSFPSYHKARADIYTIEETKDGQQHQRSVVVVTYYERGHISQRGRHWTYHVNAFEVETGARVELPHINPNRLLSKAEQDKQANSPLKHFPRPQYFSEMGF